MALAFVQAGIQPPLLRELMFNIFLAPLVFEPALPLDWVHSGAKFQ